MGRGKLTFIVWNKRLRKLICTSLLPFTLAAEHNFSPFSFPSPLSFLPCPPPPHGCTRPVVTARGLGTSLSRSSTRSFHFRFHESETPAGSLEARKAGAAILLLLGKGRQRSGFPQRYGSRLGAFSWLPLHSVNQPLVFTASSASGALQQWKFSDHAPVLRIQKLGR